MKPALVLGLALAAKAMTANQAENELFVAPTGKLGDLAQRFPGKIMYDEQADGELFMRPWIPQIYADDELGLKIVQLPTEHVAYEDDELAIKQVISVLPESLVADDELSLMPIPPKVFVNRDWVKTAKIPVSEALLRDDEADDELAVKYVHLPHVPVAETVAYDDDELAIKQVVSVLPESIAADDEELYFAPFQRIGALPKYSPLLFDDVADDELGLKYVHLPVAETVAYDDDELLVNPPRDFSRYGFDASGHVLRDNIGRPVKPVLARFDEVADDELAVKYVHLPVAETVAYDDDELIFNPPQFLSTYPTDVYGRILRDSRGLPIQPVPARFDEVADDELAVKYVHLPVAPAPEIVAYDDDELAVALAPRSVFKSDKEYQDYVYGMRHHWDDAADDELAIKQVISVLPESIAADDELSFMPIPPKVFANRDWIKTAKIPVSEALLRDDEADDELLYLGQLIKDRVFIPRTFDDDELRAEKPSHVKAEERAQLKSELPKKQRKFRPHPDVIPMAEN